MADPNRTAAIAIIGMAGRFPGSQGLDGFWRTIREGVEVLEEFSDSDLDAARVDPALRTNPRYVRRGTVLEQAEHFDASFFGYSPREAQVLDPQQRIFLECCWEAMEHAGHAGTAAGQAVGVYAGLSMNSYAINQLFANPPFLASVGGYQVMLGSDKDFLATRVSYKLDLRGPSMTVQSACSTSLVAVVVACRALQRGECDLALAGAASINFPQRGGYLYEEGMIFSPDGHCRPFDDQAHGIRSGAGAGVVVLKRLADAVADGDTIHGVVLGGAINNDGSAKAGYTAPSVDGQLEVIATAQALAGVDPRTIGYVETHGTGTPLGDPIEIAALTKAFRASTPDVGFCRIGSLKANLGHLDAAAGVASLIKTLLVLKHRELPPLVNFRNANPQLALDTSPFVATASAAPWDVTGGAPRRAAVSSFGIGGTNAHVVLEEGPPSAEGRSTRGAHLLVVSAKTATALERATANLAAHLRAHPDTSLTDAEWTLQIGRQPFTHRRAVVVRDGAHAVEVLDHPPKPPLLTSQCDAAGRPVAFLFSGQGSQHAGMGAGLYRSERAYREAIDRCAASLKPHLGLDLREVLFGSAGAEIDETRLTQPALFATEYALATLWMSWGVTPVAMLGHSIGEYVAAHLAGVLTLDDALALVAARGRLMQSMSPGSMAGVPLAPVDLEPHLAAVPGVEVAAINAPGLCTVSGPSDRVAALSRRLQGSGVEVRALHTSHAFHSAMMEPALDAFRAVVERVALAPPRVPYVSNVTGDWITDAQATSPQYYADHLRRAVRFEGGVRLLTADPSTLLLEVGPGNALTSLARLTLGKDGARRAFASLPHPRERRPDAEAALEAAGRLWLAGVALDWRGLHDGDGARRIPLPTYPFERKRHWVDALPASAPPRAEAPRQGAGDGLYAPTWMRQDGVVRDVRLEGDWLILGVPGAIADAVAREVKAAGGVPVLVEPADRFARVESSRFEVRPHAREDLAAVVAELKRSGRTVSGAIHLWAVPATADQDAGLAIRLPCDVEGITRSLVLGHHSVMNLAEALAPSPSAPVRIVVGTFGAARVLDEPVRHPENALALGTALSLPAEVQGLATRAVDVELSDPTRAARELVAEAALADGERIVARRAGLRWVQRCERISLPRATAESLPLSERGVYLITGGLGGIGLALARWLVARASARLVLTSRSGLPPRETWDRWLAEHGEVDRTAQAIRAIREIEGAGGEVLPAAVESCDEDALRRALDEARARWGRIDGVVHCAGYLGNNEPSFRKDPADVHAVVAPKLGGLGVLVRLLRDTPLDFFVAVGSISSIVGGRPDYAAGNAVLDAFVDSSVRPPGWRHVGVLNYASWRDVGMLVRTVPPEHLKSWERWTISPETGIETFARALASRRGHVAVAPFDLVSSLESIREHGRARAEEEPEVTAAPVASETGSESPQGPPAVSPSYAAPSGDVERHLAAIWSELLGVERVGVHDDFFELGGHSLMATRVLARIDHVLGARLSLRDVFEAPTVRRLAERVLAQRPAAAPAAPAAVEPDREELEF